MWGSPLDALEVEGYHQLFMDGGMCAAFVLHVSACMHQCKDDGRECKDVS